MSSEMGRGFFGDSPEARGAAFWVEERVAIKSVKSETGRFVDMLKKSDRACPTKVFSEINRMIRELQTTRDDKEAVSIGMPDVLWPKDIIVGRREFSLRVERVAFLRDSADKNQDDFKSYKGVLRMDEGAISENTTKKIVSDLSREAFEAMTSLAGGSTSLEDARLRVTSQKIGFQMGRYDYMKAFRRSEAKQKLSMNE